ncbi:LysR family transcriptional regulator [Vulcaniibacterium thermophilum]|jgi:LysR family transcriptional regulator, putative pyruvate carboxylase regulator|uniref:Transcriptional regulator n=1 Tax=Vulcaniibacterium thermophilum TaxID=1169913 RepID=A0A918YWJ1_9GAMM|nr:LysR family transcriptional regulator [Vulcaniibacterium thermophilum]GHE27765.1 transcriptional regulator [Vulcaniibacterium thermophilum]
MSEPRTPRFAYKADRLKPLRAFCQAARLGSVSRAAEALYLSQPAVTLQLQALERELGVRLLERSGRRLTLTREGQELYELARPLVEGIDGLEAAFRERLKGLDAGELNVAAGSSTILYLLPRIVEAFRARHPEVRLKLHNVTGAGGLDLLRTDGVDLAVGSMLDVPADLSYAPVYRFEPMLITPREHPLAARPEIALQDLSPYGLILPPQRLTTYRLVDLVFQQNRVPYTVALEVGGWEVIKQYVAMGLGISIVTSICLTDADRARLAARSLARYFPSRSYGVVVRKGKYLSPQARAFIELIRPDLFAPRDYDAPGHSER